MVRETKMRSKLAKGILVLALLLPVYFAGAALGARFGLFDWRMSLGTLIIQWGPRLLIAVAVLAALSLLLTLFKAPRNGWRSAAIALLIPALGLGYLAWVRGQSADIPPIHRFRSRPSRNTGMRALPGWATVRWVPSPPKPIRRSSP